VADSDRRIIDLRSDTVTRPSPAMLDAMMGADVGDDVYGEDPTVSALERRVAALTGKAAGLFVTSGTQSNLLALLSHCDRGDEFIAGQDAHTYRFEGGGAAVLGSIQPQPIPFDDAGRLPLDALAAAIKPDDFHFARTRLACLENTCGGQVLPMDYLGDFHDLCGDRGLATHLDGARACNAAISLGLSVERVCERFDTVSMCLSKGLGCPVGSVLSGPDEVIGHARRLRKMLGGGMRQAGFLAAAGLYALDHNIERLAIDHDNASRLADGLTRLGFSLKGPFTNMVMLEGTLDLGALATRLAERGITIAHNRLVTHLDISRDDIDPVLDGFADCQDIIR
jgi:threonine aldolase